MRRPDICLYLGPADRAELQALLSNRNTSRTLVWRAGIEQASRTGRIRPRRCRVLAAAAPFLLPALALLRFQKLELRLLRLTD